MSLLKSMVGIEVWNADSKPGVADYFMYPRHFTPKMKDEYWENFMIRLDWDTLGEVWAYFNFRCPRCHVFMSKNEIIINMFDPFKPKRINI